MAPIEMLSHELPVMKDGIAVDVLHREKYDTVYGIHNFDAQPGTPGYKYRPLALVAMHEQEKVNVHSGMYRLLRRFVQYKVHSRMGMGWLDFIQLPKNQVDFCIELCRTEQARENQSLNREEQAAKAMESEMRRDPK